MLKAHTQPKTSFSDSYPSNDHQIELLIQQASRQRQGKMVDDVLSLARGLTKVVRFILTLELPLFLSPTLAVPSMVAVKRG
jgi:hypothetical protein